MLSNSLHSTMHLRSMLMFLRYTCKNSRSLSPDITHHFIKKFEEPPLEEDILSVIRDLGHSGEIKFLSDVNVNHMHQPWRSFASIINKCLSGKTTALENMVFQVENKNSKKNNDMYYPRFTKVIVDYFMAKDQAIPRRNKMFWHYARDDFIFTTIRVISKHKDTQKYSAILPQHLTNQAMLKSEAFKTYRAYATGEKVPRSKAIKKKTDSESSPKTKPSQASKGKRIKTLAKGDKHAITKLKCLTVLSEVALSKAKQMKLATKRSMKEFHISHASGSGDGVDILSKVPDAQQQTGSGTNKGAGEDEEEDGEHDSDDDNDDNDDEDDVQENDSQRTESDDEGDDFVHPNLSTYIADDQEKEKEEEKVDDDDDDVTSDQKVSTPPNYELTEEDENQQDDDTMGEEPGDEDNVELYGDLNINLSRSDAEMSMLITNPRRRSSRIDSILNPNAAVSVTPSSATIIPQTPIPIILPQQQIHDSTTTTTTVPEILNFASLFGFEHRVSSLESNLSELKQTNQFAEVLSSISGIVDKYLETKVKDTIDVADQLKSDKLREEAQAENDEFLKQIDSNIKNIIKDQVKAQVSKIMPKVEKYVTETLGAEILARSSNQPQSSYATAASLTEFKLKKILIDKIKENKSMNRSDVQQNLYNALIESYNSDKDILTSYGEVVTLKSPPKSSGKSTQEEEHDPRVNDQEEPFHQEFNTRNDDVSPVREVTDVDERLWNPSGSRTPDREWNQTKTVDDRSPKQWMTKLSQASGITSSFNEFLATPIDFSTFIMNRLKIQNLTQDLLISLTYDLIKGTCKSVVELEYHLEEVFKATNDQLDWYNPEGKPYPRDLSKLLPLISDA
ncbi:hypothetical protein Tco_1144345 [Tanacetum coccineum]